MLPDTAPPLPEPGGGGSDAGMRVVETPRREHSARSCPRNYLAMRTSELVARPMTPALCGAGFWARRYL